MDPDLIFSNLSRAPAMAMVPRVMEKSGTACSIEEDNRQLWEMIESARSAKCSDWSAPPNGKVRRALNELKNSARACGATSLGGRIKYISYGGAAMPPRIMRFFELIGIPLIGAYGSTECGGVTLCGIGENRPGNLGKPFPNVEFALPKIRKSSSAGRRLRPVILKIPGRQARLWTRTAGFTRATWAPSKRTARSESSAARKDIFYCTDGSNIYPGVIELLLENEPFIRQAVLVGDRRPFIAALIVPDRRGIAAAAKKEGALSEGDVMTALWLAVDRVNRVGRTLPAILYPEIGRIFGGESCGS